MKKTILLIAIAFLGFAATAQDTTSFNPSMPDYGINLGSHNETRTFGSETTVVTHSVDYMYPEFSKDGLSFVYEIHSFVDSIQIHNDKVKLQVPLDYEIEGKKVWEWIKQSMDKTDTLIYKTLSTELYKARVLKGMK